MGIGHMVLVVPSTTATNMVLSTPHGQNSPSITIMALARIGNARGELEHQWG